MASKLSYLRFKRPEMRIYVLLNYTVIVILCCIILANSILNICEQLAPRLYHLQEQPQVGCNGHIELCNRKFSNITQIASHDAAFVGILPMDNQNVVVTDQLKAGIRFLQAQTHLDGQGTLSLCHTNCGMKDAGSVDNFLKTIVTWLLEHPKEVVTLLLTNGDYVSIDYFAKAFNSSGAQEVAYVPFAHHKASVLNSWPTLGELIASEKRLVAFLDSGANSSAPFILPEFDYFWETPFDTTDPGFSQCVIDRPEDLARQPKVAAQRMYIMNHFLDTNILGMDFPDRYNAKRTNAEAGGGSIGVQTGLCQRLHGRPPNGVLVDYFDRGSVFKAQNALNGL